jgi:hypothetical protein
MPTTKQTSTRQLLSPSAKRLPAVMYPPTLCTSDIQNANVLYEPQVWRNSGVRSSMVTRGSYPGLITPAPTGCPAASTMSSCPAEAPGGSTMPVGWSLMSAPGR